MSIMHNGEKVLNNLTTVPITQTINASSTETQIPSAKAVYDKINNSVLGVEITGSNYSQFDSSMLNWDCGVYVIGMTSTAQLINDLPQLVAGRLYITSISKTYESESLKYRQYRYITFGGNEFIRSIEYQSGSATYDTGWKRLCATSVEDVPKTTLSSISSNYVVNSGEFSYEVVNGICYICFVIKCITPALVWEKLCSLPHPKGRIIDSLPPHTNIVLGSVSALSYSVGVTGEFNVAFGTENQLYTGSFSYPVAES